MDKQPITKITSHGASYVGGPAMAMIAAKCPDIEVTVDDPNPSYNESA